MKYKNAIISTGKDILIVFICFFIFMFLSGGGTQNVLAAEDEVTITLDANGGKAVEPVVYKKTQSKIGMVCIPSSRQLKKYKIFVLPGWISGNIFMPPIVAFHEIPLVLRLQVLSVAGRLYSNLYIL